MPAATFPIVLARHYGGDPGVGVRVALGPAVVSLVTIPLWVPAGMLFRLCSFPLLCPFALSEAGNGI
jgi:hypothetical protein